MSRLRRDRQTHVHWKVEQYYAEAESAIFHTEKFGLSQETAGGYKCTS